MELNIMNNYKTFYNYYNIMNDCIINSFYIYLIVMISLYICKPDFLFYNQNNKCLIKGFGCGKNKTIISIHILSIFLSIIAYFITLFLLKLENI